MDTKGAYLFDSESGHFISSTHQRIAEIIHDYDPKLSLVWIPPNQRNPQNPNEKPFAILHQEGYFVMFIGEDEMDERVLQRLWMSDNTKGNALDRIEALDQARQALRLKEEMDRIEEERDVMLSILRSPLNLYRHSGVEYRS